MAINNNRPGGNSGYITPSGQAVLTNKDIDGQSASNTSRITLPKGAKSALDALTRKEGTILYSTDLSKAFVDNGSTLVAIGSGSGSGAGINFISNPDFETDTTGWATYADAAAATPADGTGGSPNVTIARNTSSPLRGSGDGKLIKDAANRQGQGWSSAFSTSVADKSKKLQISFDVNSSDANYASSDIGVYIYDVTNSQLITPSAVGLPKMTGTWTITFDSSNATSYRLIFHVASTNATAYNVFIDNVVVGPGILAQGAALSEWIDGGATTIYGSVTNPTKGTTVYDKIHYRRVGDSLECYVEFKGNTGGSEGSGAYIIGMPAGLTIDSSKFVNLVADTESQIVGSFVVQGAGGGNKYRGYLFFLDAGGGKSGVSAIINQDTGSAAAQWTGAFVGVTGSTRFGAHFTVPIAQWSGSGTANLGSADVEYAYTTGTWDSDSNATGYGQGGIQLGGTLSTNRDKTVTWQYPIQSGDKIELELSEGGQQWYPAEDFYAANGDGPCHTVFTSGTRSGFLIRAVDGNRSTVRFYQKMQMNEDGSNSTNWTTAFYWRLKKSRAGSNVGILRGTATTMGLIQMSDVLDITSLVTGSDSWSTSFAFARVFRGANGQWAMDFSFSGTNAGTATGSGTITISGVTFKNSMVQGFGGTNNASPFVAAFQPNSSGSNVALNSAGGSATNWRGTGFVLLESKPTWA